VVVGNCCLVEEQRVGVTVRIEEFFLSKFALDWSIGFLWLVLSALILVLQRLGLAIRLVHSRVR
jgi:hypothetical protein